MTNENIPLLRQWFEMVWNEGKDEAMDLLMDPNAKFIDEHPQHTEHTGADHIKAIAIELKSKFEKLRFEVGEVQASDDTETADCKVSAFYRGQPVSFIAPARIRIRDGRIVEAMNEFDIYLLEEAKKVDFRISSRMEALTS